jgi:RimJ/RimL family protein N-acetyltransferase
MNDTRQSNHLTPVDVLQGEHVYLRLPRSEELSFIRTLWGDPETMSAVGGPADFPAAKANDWFARMIQPGGPSNCYCLIFNQDDVPVGEVSFHNWDPARRSANLNVKVLAAHRGQGHARDALHALLSFFFVRVGGQLMTDDVALVNRPGQGLLASIGFERDNTVEDVCRMAITRENYVKKHGEPNQAIEATS